MKLDLTKLFSLEALVAVLSLFGGCPTVGLIGLAGIPAITVGCTSTSTNEAISAYHEFSDKDSAAHESYQTTSKDLVMAVAAANLAAAKDDLTRQTVLADLAKDLDRLQFLAIQDERNAALLRETVKVKLDSTQSIVDLLVKDAERKTKTAPPGQ